MYKAHVLSEVLIRSCTFHLDPAAYRKERQSPGRTKGFWLSVWRGVQQDTYQNPGRRGRGHAHGIWSMPIYVVDYGCTFDYTVAINEDGRGWQREGGVSGQLGNPLGTPLNYSINSVIFKCNCYKIGLVYYTKLYTHGVDFYRFLYILYTHNFLSICCKFLFSVKIIFYLTLILRCPRWGLKSLWWYTKCNYMTVLSTKLKHLLSIYVAQTRIQLQSSW